jgi:hypothetical protein
LVINPSLVGPAIDCSHDEMLGRAIALLTVPTPEAISHAQGATNIEEQTLFEEETICDNT